MQGWKIFTHSIRMIFGNLAAALRISGLLYLMQVIVNGYFTFTNKEALQSIQENSPEFVNPGFLGASLLNLVVMMVVSLWVAVAWHRYILLEEFPEGVVPPFRGNLIAAYFWKSLLLGLLIGAIGIVLLLIIAPIFGESGAIYAPMLVSAPVLYVFYRFCLILPAAAIGENISFLDSFTKTKPASGAIMLLALIAAFAAFLIQVPSLMSNNPYSVLNLIYTYVLGWVVMMGGVSILTTLYGVYVEGRKL